MSERKLIGMLFVLFTAGLLLSAAFSQAATVQGLGIVVAPGVPDEFRWALFVREERPCNPSDVAAGEKGPIARYLFCPVKPGDRLLHGDYAVDERFLLRLPDKEGTIVVRFASQVIFRQAVKPDPFTDENIPIAVIVDGRTKTTWLDSRFAEEAEIVIDKTDRARKKARLSCQ